MDIFCAPKWEIELKLKARSEYPNVWGEYKYHGNPYIQGTIILCILFTYGSECKHCLAFASIPGY